MLCTSSLAATVSIAPSGNDARMIPQCSDRSMTPPFAEVMVSRGSDVPLPKTSPFPLLPRRPPATLAMSATDEAANSPLAALAAKTRLESIFRWAGVKDALIAVMSTICCSAAPNSLCVEWLLRERIHGKQYGESDGGRYGNDCGCYDRKGFLHLPPSYTFRSRKLQSRTQNRQGFAGGLWRILAW